MNCKFCKAVVVLGACSNHPYDWVEIASGLEPGYSWHACAKNEQGDGEHHPPDPVDILFMETTGLVPP